MADQFPEKKEQILNEARALFAQYGFSRCTTADIAANCGITKAALYYYFKNKEQIFAEVVNRESDLLLTELRKIVRGRKDPMDKLHAFILARFRRIKKLLNLYRVSQSAGRELLPVADKCRERFFLEESNLLCSILEDGIDKGRFRKIRVDIIARTLIAAFKGIEADLLVSENTTMITSAMREILDVLTHGLLCSDKGSDCLG